MSHDDLNISINPTSLRLICNGLLIDVYRYERSRGENCAPSVWALKKSSSADDEIINNELRKEAEVLRSLHHPNIIRFNCLITEPSGHVSLALEIMDISLGDKVEERSRVSETDEPFPVKNIVKVAFEVAKGLKYLHFKENILHLDIKSSNILISHDFKTVKICDFGNAVSLLIDEADMPKEDYRYIGTHSWNAPEVLNEIGPITRAADIWPFGLIIWQMISLKMPYNDADKIKPLSELEDSEIEQLIKGIRPPRSVTRPALPTIDLEEYKDIIEIFVTCTTHDYKLRPNAKILVRDLKKIIKKL